MKKIFDFIFVIFIMSSNCLAMTFSQPVNIGRVGLPEQAPYHGFIIEGATYNNGSSYNEKPKTYVKGVARFGNGSDALYCKYNFERGGNMYISYGGQNNYIVKLGSECRFLQKINTDEGLTLYILHYGYKYSHVAIIGRRKDGSWIKYIDTENINKVYYSGESNKNFLGYWERPHYTNIYCTGDTIIMHYEWIGKDIKGEFRLKWDDKAQWFAIEQIIYD